jgi:hypothetical protein
VVKYSGGKSEMDSEKVKEIFKERKSQREKHFLD